MKKINLVSLLILALIQFACEKNPKETAQVNVIPQPAEIAAGEGVFEINGETAILTELSNREAARIAGMFAEKFKKASGISLSIREANEADKNGIVFTTAGSSGIEHGEGYELTVDKSGAVVRASEAAGLFYGMQTLLQLLPPEIESEKPVEGTAWVMPAVEIKDEPRFAWRGLHLDVGRHMMPLDFIKKHIDNMAMHKLNTFHWHLTEDQGWRIEIRQYPELTETGAWRKETLLGHAGERPQKFDGQRYGGFYTQDEVKEVVEYAQERFITIVPEIEMPGHSSAAIAAYPELGVTGEQIDVVTSWGVFPDIYNVEDETFTFLENVLTEVMELFPGKYIHIGGDEAMKDQWKASKKIQAKINELGLQDEHELQSYFITRIEKFLNSKGRQIIGWDEILEGGLAPNAAVMSWRGEAGGIAAAKSKHYVVMSPGSHLYFDHYQGAPEFEPLAIGGFTTLEKVYAYEPVPDTLTAEESKYIMGAQANVWTEYMKTPDHVEYMVFPRISALAEVVWSQKEDRDWENFKTRLPLQLKRYDLRGINYSRSIYKVAFEEKQDSSSPVMAIKLQNQWGDPDMYYTLDGSDPTEKSRRYSEPIQIESEKTVKAAVIKEGMPLGGITEKSFSPETPSM